jgi:glucose-6-phosphate dehydrogenase assembly protein OpcA
MDDETGRFNASFDVETAINLEAIEKQIARLWLPEAHGDDPITSLSTRANVLNLIIYAPDGETADHAQRACERLSRIHPCRVLLFCRVDERGAAHPSPEIYATCEADGEDPGAPCIERIRIPVTNTLYRRLSSLTQPLIIPELPAFLWWTVEPSVSDQPFIAMARASNFTIVDSLRFSSARGLAELTEIEAHLPARAAIADLNWQRLQPWRELTAQFFDIRAVQWALSCIREVEINVGRSHDDTLPAQALLLASWLSRGLDWRPVEARRTRVDRWYIGFRDAGGDAVRVVIRSRPCPESARGQLNALSISAADSDGESSSLSLSRSLGSELIRMHARSGEESTLHHAVYRPHLPDEALMTPILETTVRDHVFDESLALAVETMDLFGRTETP